MEYDYIKEALSNYDIIAPKIELLRHNENLTCRIGNDFLLQIHQPTKGIGFIFFEEQERKAIDAS